MYALSLLIAESVPTWTDKELLTAIGATIAALIPVCIVFIRLGIAFRNRRSAAGSGAKELQAQLTRVTTEAEDLRLSLKRSEVDCVDRQAKIDELSHGLDKAQKTIEEHQICLATEQNRIKKALQKDGHTWTEKVRADIPKFQALDPEERRTPIISVLNLKGGVGKTTITANLGAALHNQGYRTLLLDLDLQGSLTSLFMSDDRHQQLVKEGRLLGDFLAHSFDADFPNLLDYKEPILPGDSSAIVATSDTLAYAEMNLSIRWMLRHGNRDPRFLLRRELHLRRVTNAFDVVLLDCPPLINVSCVNALAASDYLLVPILPSQQVTTRVPVLLRRLKEFKESINPQLKILGIVCNRTQRAELTMEEQSRLNSLRVKCLDEWGEEVPQFNTFIRQSVEVRHAEDDKRPLNSNDEMFPAFLDLAKEIEGRWPMFCRQPGNQTALQGASS